MQDRLAEALPPPRLVDDEVLHEAARPADRRGRQLVAGGHQEARLGVELAVADEPRQPLAERRHAAAAVAVPCSSRACTASASAGPNARTEVPAGPDGRGRVARQVDAHQQAGDARRGQPSVPPAARTRPRPRSTSTSPSPGSSDRISGWVVARKCAVACLFGESSQQPTCPHTRHIRRCTQREPSRRSRGRRRPRRRPTSPSWSRCVQISGTGRSSFVRHRGLCHESAPPSGLREHPVDGVDRGAGSSHQSSAAAAAAYCCTVHSPLTPDQSVHRRSCRSARGSDPKNAEISWSMPRTFHARKTHGSRDARSLVDLRTRSVRFGPGTLI